MLDSEYRFSSKKKGLLITFVASVCCIFFFFGTLLKNPNTVYFSASGDGLQAYYGAVYHVKYDTAYWRMNGMNYPYGEQVFFTGCQPFVTNIIKVVSCFVDVSEYTVGIINCIMLGSIVLSALCVFLIFHFLRIPLFLAVFSAVAIAFLSPQIERMGGHYSLTYQFAIPLFLLLLLKFHEVPSVLKSLFMGLFVFFMAGTHFYFYGFFAIVAALYWAVMYVSDKANLFFTLKHIAIQLVLPFFAFKVILFFTDFVADRTSQPWGYLSYVSNPAGVFFPFGKPYALFLQELMHPKQPEWEGIAFVGLLATLVTVIIVFKILKNLLILKFQQSLLVTDNFMLNIFFWASISALLLSFGLPFSIKGGEVLFNYAGTLKQMRGVARFAWLFYYAINIIAVYKLHQLIVEKSNAAKYVLLSFALIVMGCDAYTMAANKQHYYNNAIPELNDDANHLPENKWLNSLDVKKYQAIIALPYIHVGSENVWLYNESGILKDVFILSLKTGLPSTTVMMSRTSLSETYKQIALVQEPYRNLGLLNDLHSTKPFLLIVKKEHINANEKHLLNYCKHIAGTSNYEVYELYPTNLKNMQRDTFNTLAQNISKQHFYKADGYYYTDSLKTFTTKFPSSLLSSNNYYKGNLRQYNVLFNDVLKTNNKDSVYTLSFWMNDFTHDLYPRSTVELVYTDKSGKITSTDYFSVGKYAALIDGGKALIEYDFKPLNTQDSLTVTLFNHDVYNDDMKLQLSDLLLMPKGDTLYKFIAVDSIFLNNKIYTSK